MVWAVVSHWFQMGPSRYSPTSLAAKLAWIQYRAGFQ